MLCSDQIINSEENISIWFFWLNTIPPILIWIKDIYLSTHTVWQKRKNLVSHYSFLIIIGGYLLFVM